MGIIEHQSREQLVLYHQLHFDIHGQWHWESLSSTYSASSEAALPRLRVSSRSNDSWTTRRYRATNRFDPKSTCDDFLRCVDSCLKALRAPRSPAQVQATPAPIPATSQTPSGAGRRTGFRNRTLLHSKFERSAPQRRSSLVMVATSPPANLFHSPIRMAYRGPARHSQAQGNNDSLSSV